MGRFQKYIFTIPDNKTLLKFNDLILNIIKK